jgi:2-polyprenyl-6-methoxyphenol hydroxylase-like FAD-dependent oxidoreductase
MRVLISGAGIGGLCLANALRRVGVSCTVFESAPQFGDIGFAITLGWNALHALRKIDPDLEQRVISAGHLLRESSVFDASGHRMFVFDLGDAATSGVGDAIPSAADHLAQRYGSGGMLSIHRSRLHSELLRALPRTSVVNGATVEECEQSVDGVVVRYRRADGTMHEERGSVLVGADGIRSPVREWLHRTYPAELGAAPQVRPSGSVLFGQVMEREAMSPGLQGAFPPDHFHWQVGRNGAVFLALPCDSAQGRACYYWGMLTPAHLYPRSEEPLSEAVYHSWLETQMTTHFRDSAHSEAQRLVAAAERARVAGLGRCAAPPALGSGRGAPK